MTNYEIARRFEAIADTLEIQGENPFKVRAYRVAAETIDDLEDDLATIQANGKLRELPGFGEAIASKTADFLATGTTALWERIKDSVPAGVVQMASVPGIGPKTAKALWEGLQIESVAALEMALQEQKVQTLAGFGAAKEKQLAEKLAAWKRLTEKMPRRWALPLAEKLANELRKIDGVERVEIAGELRAGKEAITQRRDFDTVPGTLFLIQANKEPDLTHWVEALRASGLTAFRKVVPAKDWGAALLQASDPEHYFKLVLRAQERTGDPVLPAEATEEGIYHALGLPYIEPEIRDWPEVIELAKAARLPKLITEADFKGQLHEHTTWSDGTASIREMAEAALARGYAYLAITDHSPLVTVANGLSRERVLAQLEEIERLRPEFAARGLAILSGIEVDIRKDGSLDMDDDVLERLDIVVASVHMRYKEDEAAMTARICKALSHPAVTLLGHPTGRIMGQREAYPVDIDALIDAAKQHGKALEINASAERMDLGDEHVKKAKAAGVKISINCDAHSTRALGNLSWGLCTARRAGLEAGDVLNCWDLPTLRRFLAQR